ncbi:MAG: hypothetical protein RL490_1374 [Pseudomonadota bacterium]
MTDTMLQLRSLVTAEGTLELSLADVPVPQPGPGEILVRVEASPINPSDLGLLLGAADMATATAGGTATHPTVSAAIPPAHMRAMAARVGESMPVGNEGGGVVVAAGAGAEALVGKTVGIIGGAMYAQYRTVRAQDALVLPEGTSSEDAASCFVNTLTALGMTETMRREGHKALVHTAAASNLGQMLNRICIADGIPLVNIVRSAEQAKVLHDIGATYVVDSTAPNFMDALTDALAATGATIAFDAIGGGKLAGQILTAMEIAVNRNAKEYSRYGSTTHKQVYIYGGLNMAPTEFNRGFGMAWSMGGWLLFPFLQKIGAADAQKLRDRVVAELKTTFASHYTARVSLAEALSLDAIADYNRRATGTKYLITPHA